MTQISAKIQKKLSDLLVPFLNSYEPENDLNIFSLTFAQTRQVSGSL